MTIYFRPDRIEYSIPTGDKSSFGKDDQEIYNITVSLQKIEEGKKVNLINYSIDEVNNEFLHKGKFIGLSAQGQYHLQITHEDEEIQKETLAIKFNDEISNFRGCKNDLFKKQIQLGNYRIQCSYGFNKFLSVCGMSKFYEFTIEPTGIVAEKIKKMKHEAFMSASKGLLIQDEKYQKQMNRNRSSIAENNNKSKVQQHTAFKEEKGQAQQNQNSKVNEKQSQNNLFNAQVEPPIQKYEARASQKQKKEELKFYKGACKTSNFFSCLDPNNNISKQYRFIEQSYN